MKSIVVYRSDSEHGTTVENFMRDFTRQTGRTLETLDPDSPEGGEFCRTYDIVEYPSIIALSDDGKLQNFWPGIPLPMISEISYYG